MSKNHLIIFVKNPEEGKVKTRLASTVGDENALRIYKVLLEHTFQITLPVNAEKNLYYSDYIQNVDQFNEYIYNKYVQKGDDLGERMYNAIRQSSGEWADHIVLVGSDCFELNSGIIEEAFRMLETHDFVIGPAEDGGYYLIGMNEPEKSVFENKEWGKSDVLLDTILDIKKLGKSHYLLPTLKDVDVEEDLGELRRFLK